MTTNRIEIPLEGADVPVAFVTTVDGMEYIWSVEYNEDNDFYTILFKDDDGEFLYATKIILGNDLLHAGTVLNIDDSIVPRDAQTGLALRVGEDELGNPVRLYIEAA
jgi:hypothetical protein